MPVRLGQVDYLNCLPVYYPLEKKLVPCSVPLEIVKGVPAFLNRLFIEGRLDVTPLSSIEYARRPDETIILPGLSVSADGRVESIMLFSRRPPLELEGCTVALTGSSATSVALVRILFAYHYQVEASFTVRPPDLEAMLREAEAALLIGDDALVAATRVREQGLPLRVIDLGAAWKEFTGEMMVYALWTVRREFAVNHPEETAALVQTLAAAKAEGTRRVGELVREARRTTGLPEEVLKDYFGLIRHDFDEKYRRGLLRFYDYAYKLGLIEERVNTLHIWGETVG
ncbi:futalosine synthase [Thermodesulfitimonas autotrophica]|uniref:Chorismate dehydratase n=1 Tax=Thermodesulfitimonas autotrophica TaxID=1894989 RepID=A0A3N5B180_9THEO|nr:menaquinone biosynthesis protein [Thermodesulfitimonas autotrophica]RPF49380.1 futalosine synthase [Thermodesulfitimonas autotrophica]